MLDGVLWSMPLIVRNRRKKINEHEIFVWEPNGIETLCRILEK
jgi:hypothetical protein